MKAFFGVVLLMAAVTGCLSKKPLNKQSFAFNVPESSPPTISTNAPILTIRNITVAPPFDSPSLTYRTGEFSYERDPYADFLVSPAASLREPIRALLRNTAKFSSVTESDSELRGNLDLEVSVTQLYGDFRDKEHPTALLEMHFVLYSEARVTRVPKSSAHIIMQKTYARRVPLKSRTANAVVAALNEALREIMLQFAQDFPTK